MLALALSTLLLAMGPGSEPVAGDDPAFPKLRWEDGSVTVNDRCPVRHAKLNPKIAPIHVNGRAIGFC